MKFREIAFSLHQYLGLFLGIFLVIMGATGSLLVFGHEIDHLLNPNLFNISPQGERVPIELVLNNIRQDYPDLKLQSITLPQQPRDVYELRMLSSASDSSAVNIYADPYKGVILGSRLEDEGFFNFLFNLHVYLLAGDTGMTIVGIVGLLLLLISVTGVIVWPGWRRFRQGFSIKWSANWRRLNFDLHKVAGIFSVVFLLLIASTGSAIAFYSFVEPTVYSLTRTSVPSPPSSQPSAGLKPLSVEQILQKANIVLPSAKTTFISLPSSPVKPVKVRKKLVDEIHPTGENSIYIDQFSGKILRVENVLEAPLAARILGALYPLHIGRYGGMISRIIHIFVGIATTGLFFTGLVIWWHRQNLKARHNKIIKQNQMIK